MSEFWKERGKRPKIGVKYQAEIPDLIEIKQEDQAPPFVLFQDAPIPIEYFELQHFYSLYQESFDVAKYVDRQRAASKARQQQKQRELAQFESMRRRCARFKNQSLNYREQSPPPLTRDLSSSHHDDDDDDLFLESSSGGGDRSSDEEYVAPGYVRSANAHKRDPSKSSNGHSTRRRTRAHRNGTTSTSTSSTSTSQRGRSTKSKSKSKSKPKSRAKSKQKAKAKGSKSNGQSNGVSNPSSNGTVRGKKRKRHEFEVIDLSADSTLNVAPALPAMPQLQPLSPPMPYAKRSKLEHPQSALSLNANCAPTVITKVPIPALSARAVPNLSPQIKSTDGLHGVGALRGLNGVRGVNGVSGGSGLGFRFSETKWAGGGMNGSAQRDIIVLSDSD